MPSRFDVVVVGGGHNGLVCASYLAQAGLSVCVLERSSRVGGAALTEEFHPGFRNSVASYTVSLLQSKVIDDLGLRKHGLRIVPRPLANFVPSLHGAGLEMHGDVERARSAIAEHSRRDADRYPQFVAELSAMGKLARTVLLEPPVDPSGGWREHLRLARRLPRFAGLPREHLAALWHLLTGSAGHWLDRWFDTDLLKGGLGFDSIVGHYSSPYAPGSGYLLLHHALGEVNGVRGAWGHAIGGMGAIADALCAAAQARGVEVHVEQPVERIEPAGRGYQVRTRSHSFEARAVAAAVHPQTLFTQLIDAERLPPAFVERIRAWRSESASFRINVALAALPEFTCRPGRAPGEHHCAGILIAPGLDYLEQAYLDAAAHGCSRDPVIELLIPSVVDDSLAPAGAHVASLFCQHFRRHLPNGARWSDHKQRAVDAIIDTVTAHAPNFRAAVLATQALTPEDLEQRFGLIGGDIFHGAMTLDQLYWARPAVGYAQYRTPLPGLYLCASGAHPGGGVSGAPGHNAAQVMLRDRPSWLR